MPEPVSSPILQAEDLTKAFKSAAGPIDVLRGVSLELYPGESLSIKGASGSGKSTLMNILSALETPDAGQVYWEENPVRFGQRRTAKERGNFIGYVFQAYHLAVELNALENILLARRMLGRVRTEDRERAAELLDKVGLGGREKQSPQQMSGGERQRVAVARALMNQPKVVLADEPTGNLDERTGASVMDLLLDLVTAERAALILVTHNGAYAERADRRTHLVEGRMDA